MTRETKVGLLMVVMLVSVFGFMVYKKMHRPSEALADQNEGVLAPEQASESFPFDPTDSPKESTAESKGSILPAAATLPVAMPGDTHAAGMTPHESDPFANRTVVANTPKPQSPAAIPNDRAFFDTAPAQKPEAGSIPVTAVTTSPSKPELSTSDFDPFEVVEKVPPQGERASEAAIVTQTVEAIDQSVVGNGEGNDPFEAPLEEVANSPVQAESTPTLARDADPFETVPAGAAETEVTPAAEPELRAPVSLPTEVVEAFNEPRQPTPTIQSTPTMKAPTFEPSSSEVTLEPQPVPVLQADEDRFGGFRPVQPADRAVIESNTDASVASPAMPADDPFSSARRPAPVRRIDEDFAPRVTAQMLVPGETYSIEPNDNFWTISRKKYGTGRYFMALAQHNLAVIPDPKRMKPGVVISTPSAESLERSYSQLIPKAAPAADASVTDAAPATSDATNNGDSGFFVTTDGTPMYRIGKEDTLSDIARHHLGRSSRWVQIYEMNRDVLTDGNSLKIGTQLRLPLDASRVDVVGTSRSFR